MKRAGSSAAGCALPAVGANASRAAQITILVTESYKASPASAIRKRRPPIIVVVQRVPLLSVVNVVEPICCVVPVTPLLKEWNCVCPMLVVLPVSVSPCASERL